MTTSIKYVPPQSQGAPRSSPVMSQRQQYSPPNPPFVGGSPAFVPGNRPRPDIDQQMRMFMVEARGAQGPPRQRQLSRSQQRVFTPPGGRGAPALASSATYITGGQSPRVVTRTEVWPVPRQGGSPTPPSSSPNVSPQARTPQTSLPNNNNLSEQWQQQQYAELQPQYRSSSRGSSHSPNRLSMDFDQPAPRSRSNTLERRSPSVEPRIESMASSMSPPPTPPAKDDFYESPKRPYNKADSVLLPPPRAASIMPRRSSSLKRENNPNLRIAIGPPSQQPLETPPTANGYDDSKDARRSQDKRKKPQNNSKKDIMQGVLGIYPAENKLPPGRSTADALTSRLVPMSNFFRRDRSNNEPPLSSKSDPTPLSGGDTGKENTPQTGSYSPQSFQPYHQGNVVAELPGDIPEPPATAERRRSPPRAKNNSDRKPNKHRKKGSKQQVPEAVNSQEYEHRPLPAVPPGADLRLPSQPPSTLGQKRLSILIPESNGNGVDAKARFRMTGHFSPDSSVETEIVDWFETLYIEKGDERRSQVNPKMKIPMTIDDRASVINPESAVRGLMSNRSTRMFNAHRSRGRSFRPFSTQSADTDWGSRVSTASIASSVDPFQYDLTVKGGLDTIGEDEQPSVVPGSREPSPNPLDIESDGDSKRDTLRATIQDALQDTSSENSVDISDGETHEFLDDNATVSGNSDFEVDDRYSLLESEIEAILSKSKDYELPSSLNGPEDLALLSCLTDIAHTSLTAPSEWDNDDDPSTAGLPDSDIEAILAGKSTRNTRMRDTMMTQGTNFTDVPFGETIRVGLDRGVLFDVTGTEAQQRRTQYMQAGRNSEYDGDIIFALKPDGYRSPASPPPVPPLPAQSYEPLPAQAYKP